MQTAHDVLVFIDERIEELKAAAAGPCVDALTEPLDREAYREALRRAHGLKAIQKLRGQLLSRLQADGEEIKPKSKRKQAAA